MQFYDWNNEHLLHNIANCVATALYPCASTGGMVNWYHPGTSSRWPLVKQVDTEKSLRSKSWDLVGHEFDQMHKRLGRTILASSEGSVWCPIASRLHSLSVVMWLLDTWNGQCLLVNPKLKQITLYSALEGLQNFHGKMEETISMIITWIINKWAKKGNFPLLFFSPRL